MAERMYFGARVHEKRRDSLLGAEPAPVLPNAGSST